MSDNLHIWEATNAPGEPTCLNGNGGDSGYSLSLYRDTDGSILGGIISDEDGVVTAFGYVHSSEYLAEAKPE